MEGCIKFRVLEVVVQQQDSVRKEKFTILQEELFLLINVLALAQNSSSGSYRKKDYRK